jgi:hypothetical protein
MSNRLFDLSRIVNNARVMINSLGIGNAIDDLVGSLGCLGSNSVVMSAVDQIDGAASILGLDLGSVATSDTVYGDMKTSIESGGVDMSSIASTFGFDIDTIQTQNDLKVAIEGSMTDVVPKYKTLGVGLDNIATKEAFTSVVGQSLAIDTKSAVASLGMNNTDMLTTENLHRTLDSKVLSGDMDMSTIATSLGFNIDTITTSDSFLSAVQDVVPNTVEGVTAACSSLSMSTDELYTNDNFLAATFNKIDAGNLIAPLTNISSDSAMNMVSGYLDEVTAAVGLTSSGEVTSESYAAMLTTKITSFGFGEPYTTNLVAILSSTSDSADTIDKGITEKSITKSTAVQSDMVADKVKLPVVYS